MEMYEYVSDGERWVFANICGYVAVKGDDYGPTAVCCITTTNPILPWASCQIRELRMRRECRERFPATAGLRSRHASRHVRHARAVMHVGIAN